MNIFLTFGHSLFFTQFSEISNEQIDVTYKKNYGFFETLALDLVYTIEIYYRHRNVKKFISKLGLCVLPDVAMSERMTKNLKKKGYT